MTVIINKIESKNNIFNDEEKVILKNLGLFKNQVENDEKIIFVTTEIAIRFSILSSILIFIRENIIRLNGNNCNINIKINLKRLIFFCSIIIRTIHKTVKRKEIPQQHLFLKEIFFVFVSIIKLPLY